MQLLAAIPLLGYIASARHFLKSGAVMNSLKLVKCLCNKDDIISAGEKALVLLYNGDSGDNLDALRYKRFQEKVVKNFKYVDAKDLPPTSAPAKWTIRPRGMGLGNHQSATNACEDRHATSTERSAAYLQMQLQDWL